MKRILFVLLAIISINSTAQTLKAINISVFNEDTSFPFTKFTPVHPGIEAGLTFYERKKDKSIHHLRLNFGYYHHKKVENGFYLNGEYGFRPKIKDLLTIDFSGNLGYLHSFYPGEMYTLNDQGEAEKYQQLGRPHFMAGVGLGVTLTKYSIQPFVRQEMNIAGPFAYGIPIMVHSFLKIGVNIKLKKNEK